MLAIPATVVACDSTVVLLTTLIPRGSGEVPP